MQSRLPGGAEERKMEPLGSEEGALQARLEVETLEGLSVSFIL